MSYWIVPSKVFINNIIIIICILNIFGYTLYNLDFRTLCVAEYLL